MYMLITTHFVHPKPTGLGQMNSGLGYSNAAELHETVLAWMWMWLHQIYTFSVANDE